MKLSQAANTIAQQTVKAIGDNAESVTAKPLLTQKEANEYGRYLPDGCILLRVEIVTDKSAGELGRMELFVPLAKNAIKAAPTLVLGTVMKFIHDAANHRATMYKEARKRLNPQ